MKFPIIAAALAFALGSNIAHAAPTLIAYGDINQATIETFESSSGASGPSFDGFDYANTVSTLGLVNARSWCPNSSKCLYDDALTSRKFDNFAGGTIAIGFEIGKFFGNDNLVATVVGVSSPPVTFSNIGPGLIGFLDPLGLTSVTFNNLGNGSITGNYGFDDVITGTTVVPLPAGLPLLAGGLLALGLIRRRVSAG